MITTASQLGRALACPASLTLPRHEEIDTEASRRGTALHACAEDISRRIHCGVPVDVAIDTAVTELDPEWRALAMAIPWEDIPVHLRAETPLAYDVVDSTARRLESAGHRDYSDVRDTEIAMTVDLYGIEETGEGSISIYVGDIKTGWADLGPPYLAHQLRIAALALYRLYGGSSVTVQWIRAAPGRVMTPTGYIHPRDLELYAHELREWYLVDPHYGRPVPGDHCHWCPCIPSCPAMQSAATALERTDHQWPLPAHSPRDRYEQWQLCRSVVAYMGRRLAAEAAEHPIDLGDGRVYGPREVPGTSQIDPALGMAVLLEHLTPLVGPQEAAAIATECVDPRITQTGIRQGLRAPTRAGRIPRGTTATIIRALGTRGAIERRTRRVTEIASMAERWSSGADARHGPPRENRPRKSTVTETT